MSYRTGWTGEVQLGSRIVVGVVGDAVFNSIRVPAPPMLYWPGRTGRFT